MKTNLINQTTKESVKNEYSKLLKEWKKLKKTTDFPFSQYTDEMFKDIKKSFSNKILLEIKAPQYLREIKEIHLTGKLDYNFINAYSPTSQKIYWFAQFQHLFSDREYWDNLACAYLMQSYDPKLPHEILLLLFSSKRDGKKYLMNEEDWAFFEALPDKIKVYRGMSEKEFKSGKFRFSWTLDKSIAEQFKVRNSQYYGQKTLVHELEIEKSKIIAYMGKTEKEVIIIF